MSALREHFERVRISLLAKATESGILRHKTSKGTARELLIAEFLEGSLPREFDFFTGEIMAPSGQRSGQLDIMLIPKSAPQFKLASNVSLGLLHAVAAAIEVKSALSTAPIESQSELRNALETTQSLRCLGIQPPLIPWPWSADRALGGSVKLDHIPVFLVAFEGPTEETLANHLMNWSESNPNGLPNTVTCLDRNYTLVRNDGWIYVPERLAESSRNCLYLRAEGSALEGLFDYMMKALQAWSYARPRTPLSAYLGG